VIKDKFRALFEMSKIFEKKLAKVLEKVAKVDQKATEIVPPSVGPSAGPMAANHECFKELERQIRNYELMVEENLRITESLSDFNPRFRAVPSAGALGTGSESLRTKSTE